jgi:hypothetical protein
VRLRRLYVILTPVARPVSRRLFTRVRAHSEDSGAPRPYRKPRQTAEYAVTWPPAATTVGMAIITTRTPASPRRTRFVAHLLKTEVLAALVPEIHILKL